MATAGGAPVPIAGDAFFMIDASNPFAAAVSDATGRDSRIVFEYGYPDGIGGISVDSQRSLVYIGWPASNVPTGALDIWASDRGAHIAFNTPPVANAGPDQTVEARANPSITLDGSRSRDDDGDSITYAWRQIGGTPAVLSPTDPQFLNVKPTFQTPKVDQTTDFTFELVVNDGTTSSAPDQVTITVRKSDELHLRPRLIVVPKATGTRQLAVFLEPGDGSAPDGIPLVGDPRIEYRWLKGCRAPVGGTACQPLIPGVDGIPDVSRLNEIKKTLVDGAVKACVVYTLVQSGVPTPGKIHDATEACKLQIPNIPFDNIPQGEMVVDAATGTLTVGVSGAKAPGFELVQAVRHDPSGHASDDMKSNVSLVLSGLELTGIDLKPQSGLSTPLNLAADALHVNANPPLILVTDQNGWFLDKGVVLFDDATLTYLGTGKVKLSALSKIVEGFLTLAGAAILTPEQGPVLALAESDRIVTEMAALTKPVLKITATTVLSTLGLFTTDSADPAVAAPVQKKGPFSFLVQGKLPGLTKITGTLDLGDWGKGDDDVFTWVLPQIESARIEPTPTTDACVAPIGPFALVIPASSNPDPGPSVRTFAQWSLGNANKAFKLKGSYKTAAELLNRFLPYGINVWRPAAGNTVTFQPLEMTADLSFCATAFVDALLPASLQQFVRVQLQGTVKADCDPDGTDPLECRNISFTNLHFGAHLPDPGHPLSLASGLNLLITNHYSTEDTSIATVSTDLLHPFDFHVNHKGKVGQTLLDVEAGFLSFLTGSKTDKIPVFVVGNGPVLTKTVAGGKTAVPVGTPLGFEITVTNPLDTAMNAFDLVDEQFFTPFSTGIETLVHTETVPIAPLVAHGVQAMSLPLNTTPTEPGIVRNKISAPGALPVEVQVLILDGPLLTKEVAGGKTAVSLGTPIGFEITATNPFDDPLVNVELVDEQFFTPLSTGIEVLVDVDTIPLGTMAPHAVQSLSLPLHTLPTEAGRVRNKISAHGTKPAEAVVLIQDGPILTKNVAGGKTIVPVGAPIGFEITVTNPFDDPMADVQLTDRQFFQPFGAATETLVDTVVIPVGALLAHETRPLSLPLQTTPSMPGTVRNEVSAANAKPAEARVLVMGPVLSKSVSGGKASVLLGDAIGFDISVSNPFDDPMPNVQLTDRQFFTPSGGAGVETLVDTVPIPIGTVPPHGTVSLSLPLTTAPTQAGTVRNEVSAPNAVTAQAIVVVQNPAVLTKTVVGGASEVFKKAPVAFEVTVTNPNDDPLDVQVTDTLFFRAVPANPETTLQTSAVSFGAMPLAGHETRTAVVPVVAPDDTGTLRNEVSAVGSIPASASVEVVEPADGDGLKINEIVSEPVTDWNGDGTIDSSDQWVEILTTHGVGDLVAILGNPNAPHTGFGLEFTDLSGAQVIKQFSNACGASPLCIPQTAITFSGLLMVVQNPGPMAAKPTVRLRDLRILDPTAQVVDEITVTGMTTGTSDEGFARVPNGFDTDEPSDFRRVAATKGADNPDGPPIINEVVSQPATDWNHDGVVDSHDQWIEINFGGTSPMADWQLEFTAASGGIKSCRLDQVATIAFVRLLVVQDPGSCLPVPSAMAEHATVVLRNLTTSTIVDSVTVTGSTTGVSDEGFARSPDTVGTFMRVAATRGGSNP